MDGAACVAAMTNDSASVRATFSRWPEAPKDPATEASTNGFPTSGASTRMVTSTKSQASTVGADCENTIGPGAARAAPAARINPSASFICLQY